MQHHGVAGRCGLSTRGSEICRDALEATRALGEAAPRTRPRLSFIKRFVFPIGLSLFLTLSSSLQERTAVLSTPSCAGVHTQVSHLAGPQGWRGAPGLGPLLEAPDPITAEPGGPSKEALLAVPTGHLSTADIRPAHFGGGRPGPGEVCSSPPGPRISRPQRQQSQVQKHRCKGFPSHTAGKGWSGAGTRVSCFPGRGVWIPD